MVVEDRTERKIFLCLSSFPDLSVNIICVFLKLVVSRLDTNLSRLEAINLNEAMKRRPLFTWISFVFPSSSYVHVSIITSFVKMMYFS